MIVNSSVTDSHVMQTNSKNICGRGTWYFPLHLCDMTLLSAKVKGRSTVHAPIVTHQGRYSSFNEKVTDRSFLFSVNSVGLPKNSVVWLLNFPKRIKMLSGQKIKTKIKCLKWLIIQLYISQDAEVDLINTYCRLFTLQGNADFLRGFTSS